MFNLMMIGLEMSLIMYFYNFAINTSDISIRMLACAAMTMEVYFIKRHLESIKNSAKMNKK